MRWKMKSIKNEFYFDSPVNLQEKLAPCRGSATSVVARVSGRVAAWEDGESTRQADGLAALQLTNVVLGYVLSGLDEFLEYEDNEEP